LMTLHTFTTGETTVTGVRFAFVRPMLMALALTGLMGFGQTAHSQGSQLQRIAKIILSPGCNSLYSAIIDPGNGRAYFTTSGSANPGKFIAVALGAGNAPPTEIGAMTLPNGVFGMACSGIDTVHGYAYIGNLSSDPAVIVKIALNAGMKAPQMAGALVLNRGETGLVAGTIDSLRGYGYFCSNNTIVKIALGAGNAQPTRIGALTVAGAWSGFRRLLLDESTGYLYAVTMRSPGQVFKIDPGNGNSLPSVIGSVTFPFGEQFLDFAALDSATGYGYLGTYQWPAKLIKFALGPGRAAPFRIGSITTNLNFFTAGGIDPVTHLIYVGNDESFPTSSILEFNPGQGNSLPSLVTTIALQPGSVIYNWEDRPSPAYAALAGEVYIQSAVIDPAGYAYFGTDTVAGQVIKIRLAGH